MQKLLTVVISERDDPVGTMITMRSVFEDLKSCEFEGEVVIVDNSTNQFKQKVVADLTNAYILEGSARLYKQEFPCLFSARDLGVQKAEGKYILVLDSHCLLYRDTIKNMIEFAEKTPDLGILFGSMCYSKAHHLDAFCDRDVKTFAPIRVSAYPSDQKVFKVPLRSMPYLISKELFTFMRGYAPLSTYKLVWGGGDFLISFKPLLLGYENWAFTDYGAIHLGPFNDKGWFAGTYLMNGSPHGRHLGMMTAAYVIGGEELLNVRISQLKKRKGNSIELERMKHLAVEYAAGEQRWLKNNSKVNYNQLCLEFSGKQGDWSSREHPIENLLPLAGTFKSPEYYAYTTDRKKIKRTGVLR